MLQVRRLLPLCASNFKCITSVRNVINKNRFSTRNKTEQNTDDSPVRYSSTPAFKYKAKVSRTGVEHERLWYEPYVCLVSIAAFLIYFCILREENDIDKEFSKSLYSRIEGLEEAQLKLTLKYNEEHGLETIDIRKRLEEIEKEKQMKQLS
ncbi:uncharacterized protein LOC115881130 [Sitophilus oryzae]|uniref:Uncharacterized protein LOC115881130 n=1 Tax=Sitophilus oryzae TaxID=7048 RepID=A0A6J2XUW3_SITOR|nr:uncharacterized protein LOC115881130 [Sitophilus oryzae]